MYVTSVFFSTEKVNLGDKFNMLASSSTASMNGLNSTSVYFDSGVNPNDKTFSALNNTLTVSMTTTSKAGGGNGNNSSIYVPQIRSKNSGEYVGLLEWKIEDEPKIVIKLIDGVFQLSNISVSNLRFSMSEFCFWSSFFLFFIELKPRLAVTFLPGLPAYILFMCIRYADMLNDDERVRSLLNSTVQAVKRLIKRKQEDLDYLILWLTNFCRLIHNLKQYSGEAVLGNFLFFCA